MATTLSEACSSKRVGPGSITLEALLDSPSLSPPSPLSESLSRACTLPPNTNVRQLLSVPVSSRDFACSQDESNAINNEILAARKKACMRDVCMELLTVLRSQDVHGYFLSPKVYTSGIGLLELEKRVLRSKYTSFEFFQTDVFKSLNVSPQNCTVDPLLNSEGQRLVILASDWFASLSPDLLRFLTPDPPDLAEDGFSSVAKASGADGRLPYDLNDLKAETHLRVLNPDNQGIIGPNECVLTLGEEVGPLRCGTGLLPHGGYREDRRNKVVPYTYLDYGPYYTFAPRYDSGASHCTPEANQLVLGTAWLPARLAYLSAPTGAAQACQGINLERDDETCEDVAVDSICECGDDDIAKAVSSELVSAALASGDQTLAVALAVGELDQIATGRLSDELMELLPGPEVEDESCVFALCLANAFTRDWLRDRQNLEEREGSELPCDLGSVPERDVSAQAVAITCGTAEDHQVSGKTVEAMKDKGDEVGLEDTAADLRRLLQVQYRRLGQSPQVEPGTDAQTPAGSSTGPWPQLQPGSEELTTAHRLAGSLVRLLGRARPRDVVHPHALRRAMGLPPDYAPVEQE